MIWLWVCHDSGFEMNRLAKVVCMVQICGRYIDSAFHWYLGSGSRRRRSGLFIAEVSPGTGFSMF